MDRLDSTGYYALGVPMYAAVVAAELLVARARRHRVYEFAPAIGNLAAGIGEVVLGLLLGPLLLALYDYGFDRIALVHWHNPCVTWPLAFLLGDLGYYGYHRAGHAIAGLWAIHGVHHHAEEMNFTVALRHPWFSDVYSAPFYAILPLAGVPVTEFFVAISVISFYALTVHTRFFHRPGLYIFVTPRTHIVHHAKNPRYRGNNLGAMFTIWDRLFGTHVELDPGDPPVLGTAEGYRTHDGALAQWLGFRDLARTMRATPRLADKLRVLIKHPGWRPPGAARPSDAPARPDAEIPRATKIYVAVTMALTVTGAMWVLWLRERHPPVFLIAGALAILWSLIATGALLDGRSSWWRYEVARVGFAAAAVIVAVVA